MIIISEAVEIIKKPRGVMFGSANPASHEYKRLKALGLLPIKVKKTKQKEEIIIIPLKNEHDFAEEIIIDVDNTLKKIHRDKIIHGIERAKIYGTKSKKKIGRPKVFINFKKIKRLMKEYNVSERTAIKLCKYCFSTYYKHKKLFP